MYVISMEYIGTRVYQFIGERRRAAGEERAARDTREARNSALTSDLVN